jgi:hypothetical protein
MAVFSLGSNSRVRGKAAADLSWSPTQRSVTRWITYNAKHWTADMSGRFLLQCTAQTPS